jgi:hypothetical protein
MSIAGPVDPELRTVQIHTDGASSVVLRSDDVLELPEILPGFSCRVSELFEE